jgi:hypothetical protein
LVLSGKLIILKPPQKGIFGNGVVAMFDRTKLITSIAAAFLGGVLLAGPAFAQSVSLYGGGAANVGVGAGGGGGSGMDPAGGGPGASGGYDFGRWSSSTTGPAAVAVAPAPTTKQKKKTKTAK